MKNNNEETIAYKVSNTSIFLNIILSIGKFLAGLLGNSKAMISDAIHSLSDVFSTVIVIIGIKISSKDSDASHPYGHEKFECIAAIILSFMLFITGIGIGVSAIKAIVTKSYVNRIIPSILPLIFAVISIVLKEAMYWYTRYYAKKIDSTALMADAWHHRSDSLSSIGSFIGILGSRLGYKICDAIASLVISLFIIKAAIEIFIDAINKIVDKSCDEETVNKIKKTILSNNDVKNIDNLKTRVSGNKIFVDVEIAVEKDMSLEEAHDIAEDIHNRVETKYKSVKHCMVHVNPQ